MNQERPEADDGERGVVRRELEQVGRLADEAQARAEKSVAEAREAREAAQQQSKEALEVAKAVKKEVHTVARASTDATADLDKVKAKTLKTEKGLREFTQRAVDEEDMMAQLSALQERYENELAKCRQECAAMVAKKDQEVAALRSELRSMVDGLRAQFLDSSKEQANDAVRLAERVEILENSDRARQFDQQSKLQSDFDKMKDHIYSVERNLGDLRALADRELLQPRLLPPPPPPPLPPIIPISAFEDVKGQMGRMGNDLRALVGDFSRLTRDNDVRIDMLHDHFQVQLRELGAQVFSNLDRDTNAHITEIKRLKDALFELQGDVREVKMSVRRIVDEPSDRHPREFGPSNRRRYDEQYNFQSGQFERRPVEWPPRRRSRSRSRSPPRSRRRSPFQDRQAPTSRSWDRQQREDYQLESGGYDQQQARAAPPQGLLLENGGAAPDTNGRIDVLPSSGQQRPAQPNERASDSRAASRASAEVIVIEEDDPAVNSQGEGEEDLVPPNMAPPDIVLEDGEEEGFIREDDLGSGTTSHAVSPAPEDGKLHSIEDLRIGFLLYFCLGGAPTLLNVWTRHFHQLKRDEYVDASRALSFQHGHQFLEGYPMLLTQCVVQSVLVNGSSAASSLPDDTSTTQRVDNLQHGAVSEMFSKLVREIRQEWATETMQFLASELPDNSAIISVNPRVDSAAGSEHVSEPVVVINWMKRQTDALLALARARGSNVLRQSLDGDLRASSAVYLLVLMFDVVRVSSAPCSRATVKLNAFGAKLLIHLWRVLLKHVPYFFFTDWTWLEEKSEKGELSPLAFSHLLATVLLSNSLAERSSLARDDVYVEVIELLMRSVRVDGQSIEDAAGSRDFCVPLGRVDSVAIELESLDQKLFAVLALDGCMDVCKAIAQASALQDM